MELTGWYVIVPFCAASLVTGLIMSLGTPWGLFRHYWVLMKFPDHRRCCAGPVRVTQTLGSLGDLAANPAATLGELRSLKQSPVLHSGGAMLALLGATVLAVYKPWGLTSYGRRKQHTGVPAACVSNTTARWKQYLLIGTIGLVLLLLILHLISGGPRGH